MKTDHVKMKITGQLEASDVRVKRFAREEWINKGAKCISSNS